MLSVLIPTYNYNVFFLVKEMHQQLISEGIDFEIICLDDGSNSLLNIQNKKINRFSFTSFNALDENIGRSAIRNLLAKKARYNWFLFLDADVIPVKYNFVKNYITCFTSNNTVFCGGISYQNNKENFDLLRYKYGKKHEAISLKKRIKNEGKYFFTSNFLIQKDIFNSVKFKENLIQYGKEDLLFSIELIKKNYLIKHLSNEVYHLGIDHNLLFVSKTKSAMENLVFLEKKQLIDAKEIPLLNLVRKLTKIKTAKLVAKFYPFFERLTIYKSSVFFLNCMKVSYLCSLKSKYE